jgi:hypothetical protein
MIYKAEISFAGAISMTMGERRELDAASPVTKDLLKAGYIKPEKTTRRAKNAAVAEGK